MMKYADFLLIGGGLAAATAAETLRAEGAGGSILMIAREDRPPYHRPPLSKEFLSGEIEADRFMVLPADFYAEQSIELMLATEVTAIDPRLKRVRTDRGDEIGFGKALIATGADPVPPSAAKSSCDGVFLLRTFAEAAALRAAAKTAKRAVVVGASVLGMEVASTLAKMGLAVTVIEKRSRLFPNIEGHDLASFFFAQGQKRGVEILLNDELAAILGDARVTGVVTASGLRVACDLVVLATGVAPNISFVGLSDIATDDGILVDRYLQTNWVDVFAAGDVACFDDPVFRLRRRIEHWDNAIKQGRLAAKNMLGQHLAYDEVSYFFSGCFDQNFQFIGTTVQSNAQITRGSPEKGSYAVFFLKDGVIRALVSMGRPAEETRAAQALIRAGANLADALAELSDPDFPIETIPNQTVLILQGGGAMGAFECGVVRALEEARIHPNVVAGVSIGAFNGAIVAGNPGAAGPVLESFWRNLMVDAPPWASGCWQDAATSWKILSEGVPNFFRPRWPILPNSLADRTSIYDWAPAKALLAKYVDFASLKNSPVRLLVSAVNVETGQLEVFDSYADDLTPDHIVASGSLPPGFAWTTIGDKHYWDGGILSNSPLELVIEKCGESGKRVFIVDLYAQKRPLPSNFLEVQARRDEIVFSERIRNNMATRELVASYRKLVEEALSYVGAEVSARIRARPRYIELMGDVAPITVMRFIREGASGDSAARDYDFSRRAIEHNISDGYALTIRELAKLSTLA